MSKSQECMVCQSTKHGLRMCSSCVVDKASVLNDRIDDLEAQLKKAEAIAVSQGFELGALKERLKIMRHNEMLLEVANNQLARAEAKARVLAEMCAERDNKVRQHAIYGSTPEYWLKKAEEKAKEEAQ